MCPDVPLDSDDSTAETIEVEFYFEEYFTGEPFTIALGDRVVATIEPTTRMQIGLAHVEPTHCRDGEVATVSSEMLDVSAEHTISADEPFLRVTLHDGDLQIAASWRQPGFI